MKYLFRLIVLFLLFFCQNSTGQTNVLQDTRVAPLLKQAAAGAPNLIIYGRKDASRYVNMAVLDKARKTCTWFTCYGAAYDSTKLTEDEYGQIVSKTIDPFDFYKGFCLEQLAYIEDAESVFRQLGYPALKDTTHNRQLVYNSPSVKAGTSSLQKVMAIEGLVKQQCLQYYLFDSKSPSSLVNNDSLLFRKSLAGKMISRGDTVSYYNTYLLGKTARIVLYKQVPGKMYVYSAKEQLLDSVPLKPGKYTTLLQTKEDVFLLYRGWLEMQSQQVVDARQQLKAFLISGDTSRYTPASSRKISAISLSELDAQQWAIENKISQLIIPDRQIVSSVLKDAYPNAPSEISYLGGLGFAYSTSYVRGQKVYELGEHRGNVLATVSDKKKAVDENSDGIIEYYAADVVNANDYYPFGSLMAGRTYNADGAYRYGFNGKENDNEVKGEGNQQDYGMRIYDPRIGKFLSVDPLTSEYPWYTPYQFAGNTPVQAIDLDGAEEELTQLSNALRQKALLQMDNAWYVGMRHQDHLYVRKPNWGERWKEWNASKSSIHTGAIISRLAYGTLNDAKIAYTSAVEGKNHAYGIDNVGVTDYKDRVGAGLNTLAMLAPVGGVEAKLEEEITYIEANTISGKGAGYNINRFTKEENLTNCAGCAIAGDATLNGRPAQALNHKTMDAADFFLWFSPLEIPSRHTKLKEIEMLMKQAGDGATGVIFGHRPEVGGFQVDGHFFNVINEKGKIIFMDFQQKPNKQIIDTKDLMTREGYDELYFRTTNR